MRPGLGAGDVGSSPGPALLYSVSLSKGLCSVVFQFSEILSKRSAWLAQKAIIGFNICNEKLINTVWITIQRSNPAFITSSSI